MNDPLATRAAELAARLQALLEQEFESLRQREPARVEELQPQKSTLLAQIQQLMEAAGAHPGRAAPPGWDGVLQQVDHCRDLHQRNVALVDRQLEVVRGALRAMQGDDAPAQPLYDRRPRRGGAGSAGRASLRYA